MSAQEAKTKQVKNESEHYKVLEISPDATLTEIREAYYRKVKKCHPDVNPSDEAKELFEEVHEAYKVLGNIEKRKSYDKERKPEKKGPHEHKKPSFGGTYEDKTKAETISERDKIIEQRRKAREMFYQTRKGAFPERGWNRSSEKTVGAVSMKIPIEINRMTEEQKAELCENTASNRMHNRLTNFFQKYWIDFGGHDRIDSPWFAGVSARATNLQGVPHELYANQSRTVYFWLIWVFMACVNGMLLLYEDSKTSALIRAQKSVLQSMPNDGKGMQHKEIENLFSK